MPHKRMTTIASLALLFAVSGAVQAQPTALANNAIARVSPHLLTQLPTFNPAPGLASSTLPSYSALLAAEPEVTDVAKTDLKVTEPLDVANSDIKDLREALISVAMQLRDTRYRRGGRSPATGFDCSGFVRYVFANATGIQLPSNSASQFMAGLGVKRADMEPGDLVFFRTHGKRGISHVGIYISEGRFIHSPTTGKSVQVSNLSEGYWAKRFAGAKRPQAMAEAAANSG